MKPEVLLQNDPLWNRLREFSLDVPDTDFPFSKKLAKEEGWTADFTSKAIEEYKKFVYLCCKLPSGASPSQVVDKVWHMHLIYTRNYWEEFCPDVLHRKLHHQPSNGGKIDKMKHKKWFEDTLEKYHITFGAMPPEEIWMSKQKKTSFRNFMKMNFKIFLMISIVLMINSCSDYTKDMLSAVASIVGAIIVIVWFILGFKNKDKNSGNNNDGGSCGGSSSCGSSCSGGCGGGCGGCGGD